MAVGSKTIQIASTPAILQISFVGCRLDSIKYTGTVITAFSIEFAFLLLAELFALIIMKFCVSSVVRTFFPTILSMMISPRRVKASIARGAFISEKSGMI